MDGEDSQATCSSLLGEVPRVISDVSVLRCLLFAATIMPHGTPDYCSIIAKFVINKPSVVDVSLPEQTRLIVENIAYFDKEALSTDDELFRELAMMPFKGRESVGVVLISKKAILCEVWRKLVVAKR